jgi:hypothetical protein
MAVLGMNVARQWADLPFRPIVTLTATCVVIGNAYTQDAAEIQASVAVAPELSGRQDADSAAVSGVFEMRWPAVSAEDYILGEDGSLKHAAANEEQPHSGTFDSLFRDDSEESRYTDRDIRFNARKSGQPDSSAATENVASECGPSPIEPTGIKTMVEQAATRHGVNPGFAVAVVATESDFDRNRNSPKGARGPMQLMPDTAVRFNVGDICDPVANIDGGVRYLRTLLDEFGNPLLAAAAYNAAEHRIYEYGGIPPFTETVNYVAKVVNHQLGFAMPSTRKARAPIQAAKRTEVGIVLPKKTGSFVAGVMHF